MRPIKTRPRFHCDFCSYTSSSVSGMTAHERRCWANPNRICDLCKNTGIMEHDGIALRYGDTELTPTLTNGIFLWLTQGRHDGP